MSTEVSVLIGIILGGVICLVGLKYFSKPSLRPSGGSPDPFLDLERRVEKVEGQIDALKSWRRDLESEWESSHQRLRSALGRLDKAAGRAAGKKVAEEGEENGGAQPAISDAEILHKVFPG